MSKIKTGSCQTLLASKTRHFKVTLSGPLYYNLPPLTPYNMMKSTMLYAVLIGLLIVLTVSDEKIRTAQTSVQNVEP